MENDKSLQNLNTFHIDASAKYYTEASTNEELLDILSDKKMKEEKKTCYWRRQQYSIHKKF